MIPLKAAADGRAQCGHVSGGAPTTVRTSSNASEIFKLQNEINCSERVELKIRGEVVW